MRALIQRVAWARVRVAGETVGTIERGLLVLLGIEGADGLEDSTWLAGKIAALRIFSDREGKMNANLAEVGGRVLVVSQFTLHASYKKGNRPSFIRAARPEQATELYEQFLLDLALQTSTPIEAGIFGADMQVELLNDGPVTIFMDSKNRE
jgi:D-tyrosyl-tRNA(Tyr) deacylase